MEAQEKEIRIQRYQQQKFDEWKRKHPDPNDKAWFEALYNGWVTYEQYESVVKQVEAAYSSRLKGVEKGKAKREEKKEAPWLR